MIYTAPKRLAAVALWLMAAAIAACGSSTGPGGGGPAFGGIGGLLGGFSSQGGLFAFGYPLDSQFVYLYFNNTQAEGPWNCVTDGHCSLAGMRRDFGTIAEPDSFMFVSSANVILDGTNRVVRAAGVQTKQRTIANSAQYTTVRLNFEFVFASARLNSATHNDSAIVRIKAGTDSATLFKITTADLQAARFAARTGGCGTASIVAGRAIPYPNCTQWIATTADITAFKGRTFVIQFIVGEGSQSVADVVDQPSTFLFRKLALEGAK